MTTTQLLQKVYDFFHTKTQDLVSSELLNTLPESGPILAQLQKIGLLDKTGGINFEHARVDPVYHDDEVIDLLMDGQPLLNKRPQIKHEVIDIDAISFQINFKGRSYKIFGIERRKNKLNCTIRLDTDNKLHVDSLNLFHSTSRDKLIQGICQTFNFPVSYIKGDFQTIVRIAEEYQFKEPESKLDLLSKKDIKEALTFAKSRNIVDLILRDYELLGSTGEENNKLVSYIAGVSRLLKKPLSVMVISSSGAGKSDLVKRTLDFLPEESVVELTSLSAKALFYKAENSLKCKVLSLEEDQGGESASYALRQLISSSSLTVESTVRDQLDGKIKTQQNKVNCQTAVFITSTNPDTDPETKSRFFILHVDESEEQTKRIVSMQMQSRSINALALSIDCEKILNKHHNFHRLLKAYLIVNPFADSIDLQDWRLGARRNFPKYLTLIDSICLLRQHQKETKLSHGLEYLEVEQEDMELAQRLFNHVIDNSTSDLNSHTRELLRFIKDNFDEESFSRRDIRDRTFWSFSKVQRCMTELLNHELVMLEAGGVGRVHQYKIVQTCSSSSEQLKELKNNELDNTIQ